MNRWKQETAVLKGSEVHVLHIGGVQERFVKDETVSARVSHVYLTFSIRMASNRFTTLYRVGNFSLQTIRSLRNGTVLFGKSAHFVHLNQ